MKPPTVSGKWLFALMGLLLLGALGFVVAKSGPLTEMDPVDLDQRVTALDAGLARARSAVAVARAQQQDAVSKRELAAIIARRYTKLGAQKFVSQSVGWAKRSVPNLRPDSARHEPTRHPHRGPAQTLRQR